MTNFKKIIAWLEENYNEFMTNTEVDEWSTVYVNGYTIDCHEPTGRIFVEGGYTGTQKEYKKPIMAVKSCLK